MRSLKPLRVVPLLLATSCLWLYGMNEVKLSLASDELSAGSGVVRTMEGPFDTTQVIVRVKHLAPPERVVPGATTYVVWVSPEGADTVEKAGAFQVDDRLQGSVMVVLPYDAFRLFITAEPSASVTTPAGQELLVASVGGRD